MPRQCHAIGTGGLIEIELGIDIPERRADCRQLMEQPAFVLPRLDRVLLAGELVEDGDADAGLADAIAQLGGEVPLNLLS